MTSTEVYSTVRTGALPERCAAAAGLALALVLLRLPLRHTVRNGAPATRLPCSGVSTRGPGSSSRNSVPALACGRPLLAPHVALLIALPVTPRSVVIGENRRSQGPPRAGRAPTTDLQRGLRASGPVTAVRCGSHPGVI
ncbi:hypothetical protein [Streptomyces sp. NPDC024089]|uniref:hypothetical protein n=1 Tax=Streptomyces sp. NPDC024089 TaxID=3154328 RepID=UPI003411AF91